MAQFDPGPPDLIPVGVQRSEGGPPASTSQPPAGLPVDMVNLLYTTLSGYDVDIDNIYSVPSFNFQLQENRNQETPQEPLLSSTPPSLSNALSSNPATEELANHPNLSTPPVPKVSPCPPPLSTPPPPPATPFIPLASEAQGQEPPSPLSVQSAPPSPSTAAPTAAPPSPPTAAPPAPSNDAPAPAPAPSTSPPPPPPPPPPTPSPFASNSILIRNKSEIL